MLTLIGIIAVLVAAAPRDACATQIGRPGAHLDSINGHAVFGIHAAAHLNALVDRHLAAWVHADASLGRQIQYFASYVDLIATQRVQIALIHNPGRFGQTALRRVHADLLCMQDPTVPAATHVDLSARGDGWRGTVVHSYRRTVDHKTLPVDAAGLTHQAGLCLWGNRLQARGGNVARCQTMSTDPNPVPRLNSRERLRVTCQHSLTQYLHAARSVVNFPHRANGCMGDRNATG